MQENCLGYPGTTHHMMRPARRHASTANLVIEGIRLLRRTYSEAKFATAKAAMVPTWPAREQAT